MFNLMTTLVLSY
jgi:hypothetical protein